ncbi:MAG: GAF domain-containing protein [Ignavibacteria bacterium]|nr:GAF domain-containing protein [Ignavibacteria bacterium]
MFSNQYRVEKSSELIASTRAIIGDEKNAIANMANVAAVLFNGLRDVNWAGFYLFDGTELVLGPFQGQPACLRIALGKGVCGTSAAEKRTIIVPNVEAFPGHIACDANSKSEIVIPLVQNGNLLGVLDVDSPTLDRFTLADATALEEIVGLLVYSSDFGQGASQPMIRR